MGPADMSNNICPKISLVVKASYILYEFFEENSQIRLKLMLSTPSDLQDIELLSSAISYISYNIVNEDSKAHSVDIYFDNSAEITVSDPNELVVWESNKYFV